MREEAYNIIHKPDDFNYVFDGETVRVTVNGEVLNTYELLHVESDPSSLLDAMSTHSGLMVWVGIAMADADVNLQIEKETLRNVEAGLEIQIREAAAASGEKTTEALIAARVRMEEEFEMQQARYFKALRKHSVLKSIYEAFRQRGELIRSIASTVREEQKQPYAGRANN